MFLLCLLLLIPSDWTLVAKGAIKQVPRIEILTEGEEEPGICSGVVLNNEAGFVLSAGHCVTGALEKLSITVNGRHATVVKVNHLLDLAVLKTDLKDAKEMVLASETPDVGAEIAVVGYVYGSKVLHTQFGRVSAKKNDIGLLIMDAATIPGDSGGPAIDATGALIGMTNQYYPGTGVGLAVPIEVVKEFVEVFLPKK